MAARSRPHHKDLASSFHKLRRLVVDVKEARRSLSAQHSLIADLVSVALYPPAKDSLSPRRSSLQEEDSLPEISLPFSRLRPDRPPLPPSQAAELPFSSPKAPTKIPSLSFRSLWKLLATLSSSPDKTAAASSAGTRGEGSRSRSSLTPGAYPGKRFSRPSFWMPLLLVFLFSFLYTGKEIAVAAAVSTYSVVWLTRKIRIAFRDFAASRQPSETIDSCGDGTVKETRSSRRTRTLIVYPGCKETGFSSSDSRMARRSQSSPPFSGSSEKGSSANDCEDSFSHGLSSRNAKASDNFFPPVRLSAILIFALCGLAYGHLMAVCLCSCCMLLLAMKQELTRRIGLQN